MRGLLRYTDLETTESLELRALERMAHVLCRHAEILRDAARAGEALASRESELQLAVFAERRREAEALLATRPSSEPFRIRIGRLEKLVEALECSRDYFRSLIP